MRLQLKMWVHGAVAVLVFSGALLLNAAAISAVQHAMSGTLAMGNPSTIGDPTRFKQQDQLAWGNPAITATPKVVNTTGANQTLSSPKSVFRLDGWPGTDPNGFVFRSFPNFNTVNQLRILGRWMRMLTIPNQSSVPKAFNEFNEAGRMRLSPLYLRVVDVCEELMKFTWLNRCRDGYLTQRYSERVESAEQVSSRVNQDSL